MTKPARPQPKSPPTAHVIAHPAFPVITAVWFGALFGLGAVVAGGPALAALVGHLHLAAIVPAATPPLGSTAHMLVALGLAVVGTVFGLVLGLVMQARAAGRALFDLARIRSGVIRTKAATPATAPIETADEFPGDGPQTPPITPPLTPAPRVRNRDAHPDAPPRRPLVVTEDVLPYHAPIAGAAPEPVTMPPAWTAPDFADMAEHDAIDAPYGAFMTGNGAAQVGGQVFGHDAEVPPFLAGMVGEVPPLAPSGLNQSGVYSAGEAIILPPEPAHDAELAHANPVFQTGPMPLASQATVAPQGPIAEVPVASLGLVQLIERLALAITVRQAHRVAHGALHGEVATTESAGPLLRAKPSRLGRVSDAAVGDAGEPAISDQAVPMQLHDPLARAHAADHDWANGADHDLPPRFLGGRDDQSQAYATAITPDDDFVAPPSVFGALPDDSDPVETRYSSLVNMTMVRPDLGPAGTRLPDSIAHEHNGPVVQFPSPVGDAAPRTGTDQADRALRDALATLRRMSAQR